MHSISRHQSIFDPDEHEIPVLVAGCGATGSHVSLQLTALGVRELTVIDFDVVSEHNLANQIFMAGDVGIPKVVAFQDYISDKFDEYCAAIIKGRLPESFSAVPTASQANRKKKFPILILCVDSMKARREIVEDLYEKYKTFNRENWYVIDTRMAATHGNVISFTLSDKAKWDTTLIRDEDAEASPCGTSVTVLPTVQIIASLAVWEYIKICTDPEARCERIDGFFKPTALSTRRL